MGKESEMSPQERLSQLRAERASLSEKLQKYPLSGNQEYYALLYNRAECVDFLIRDLQETIEPIQGHGEIGEFTLASSAGPEPVKKRKT